MAWSVHVWHARAFSSFRKLPCYIREYTILACPACAPPSARSALLRSTRFRLVVSWSRATSKSPLKRHVPAGRVTNSVHRCRYTISRSIIKYAKGSTTTGIQFPADFSFWNLIIIELVTMRSSLKDLQSCNFRWTGGPLIIRGFSDNQRLFLIIRLHSLPKETPIIRKVSNA